MTGDAFLGRVNHDLVARVRARLGVTVPVGSALHLHLADWRERLREADAVVTVHPSSVPGCRTVAIPAARPRLTLARRMA